MSVSIGEMTLPAAIALIDRLRMLADHIEQGGQNVYLSGDVLVNINKEIHERRGGFRQIVSQACVQTLELQSDLTLRGVPWYAPQQGIKRFRATDRAFYRWNGELPRPPKKGEFYYKNFDTRIVKCAPRSLKMPRYIVQESP